MTLETNKKESTFLIPVMVALITVLGGTIVAMINNWDKIYNNSEQKATPKIIDSLPKQTKLKDQIISSFCDAVKGLSQDAPNDFDNVKRKIVLSDTDEDLWESIYEVKDISIEIALDKDDAITQADLELFRGYDSILAIKSFNKYVDILDACLVLERSKLFESREPDGYRDWKSYWFEYRGPEYAVEIWLRIGRSENSESSTSVTIVKKGQI